MQRDVSADVSRVIGTVGRGYRPLGRRMEVSAQRNIALKSAENEATDFPETGDYRLISTDKPVTKSTRKELDGDCHRFISDPK
jgi:hypothetical protein